MRGWQLAGMVRDPMASEPSPELQDVLDALDDPDCRAIVVALEEPMTAKQIADAADVPLSTTYRKLDLLSEASLLAESTEIRRDGQHATRYEVAFEEVAIALDDERDFDVSIARPPAAPDERIEDLWAEVRRQA